MLIHYACPRRDDVDFSVMPEAIVAQAALWRCDRCEAIVIFDRRLHAAAKEKSPEMATVCFVCLKTDTRP